MHLFHVRPHVQIRLYYIDIQRVLRELCFSDNLSGWRDGTLNALNIKVAEGSSVASLHFFDSNGTVHIRVYCQGLLLTRTSVVFS